MLTEQALAFEIGLMGPSKARTFLHNLLARFQGNATAAAQSNEPPIHEMTAEEDAASDKKAIEQWNAPDAPSPYDTAVNFIFAHNGCLSAEVKKATKEAAGITDNQWANILLKLGNNPKLRKEGERVHMRWFAN